MRTMRKMRKIKEDGQRAIRETRKIMMEKTGKEKGGPELSYCRQCTWNKELFSAIYSAEKTGDSKTAIKEIKEALKQGANLNATDEDGQTILSFAASKGLNEIVKFLIDKGMNVNHMDNTACTPLFEAIHEKHYETAELLLNNGARKISKDKLHDYKNEMPPSLMKRCQAED